MLQDSASVEGALDSEIVAEIARKIAKLSLEAGGSRKFHIIWKFPDSINASSKDDRYPYYKLCSGHFWC